MNESFKEMMALVRRFPVIEVYTPKPIGIWEEQAIEDTNKEEA